MLSSTKFALGLALLAPTLTLAAPKKGKAREPIPVTVQNACAADLKVSVNGQAIDVVAGQAAEASIPAADPAKGYALKLEGAEPHDLGLLGLQDGHTYLLKLADCRAGGADVYLENKAEPPAGVSPQAAAQVRFRAREIGHIEYKFGADGRFKGLSVGMTSPQEVPAGDLPFTIRVRGAAKVGPVLATFDKTVPIKPARVYLIESHVVGANVFFKLEDEGFVGEKK